MARTYTEANLASPDTTSTDWALAFVRFVLRDTPNDASTFPEYSMTDAEISAALEVDAITDKVSLGGDGSVYYPAHRTAARLLRTNPQYAERISVAGYTETRTPASQLATRIVRANSWVDEEIVLETNARIGTVGIGLGS